jgi:hypothetical protein
MANSAVRNGCEHRTALPRHFSEREWQHYTAHLRRNQRLRYRVTRHLVVMLPLALFLFAVALAAR